MFVPSLKLVYEWKEESNGRNVFKFKMELPGECDSQTKLEIDDDRLVPPNLVEEAHL
jgi:hypothetical protein